MLDWIVNNYEWVFSGVGIAIISGLIAFLRKKEKKSHEDTRKIGITQTNSAPNVTQIGIQNNYYSGDERDD